MGDIQPKRRHVSAQASTPVAEAASRVSISSKPYIPDDPLPRRVPPVYERRESRNIRPYLWVFFSLCVGLGIFFLIEKFGTISISFSPIEKTATVDTIVALTRESQTDMLPYEVMSVEDSLEYVPTTETSVKADTLTKFQGSVRIFNAYTTKPILLEKGTILVSSQTKTTFVLDSTVSVPGYKKTGSTRIPGSVDASVSTPEAVAPIPRTPQDFSLSRYAALPEATGVYARSINALTPRIEQDPGAILRADTEQETKLKTELIDRLKKELPEGYTFFEPITLFENVQTEQVSFDPLKPQEHKQKISGKISTLIFKQSDIDTYLIRRGEMDATFKKEDPDVTLQITKQNITGKASIKDVIANGKGEIELSGDFLIKKTFEPSFLCEKLAALPLKELTSLSSSGELLAPYVNDIQVHIFPPWLFTKPSLKRFHCGFSK